MFTTCWIHRVVLWLKLVFVPTFITMPYQQSSCRCTENSCLYASKVSQGWWISVKLVELTCLSYGQWYLKNTLFTDVIKSPKLYCMTLVVWVVTSEVVSHWSLHIVYLQPWVPMVYVWATFSKINRRGWWRWDTYFFFQTCSIAVHHYLKK